MPTPRVIPPPLLPFLLVLGACATTSQGSNDGAEWRRQSSVLEARYQELDKQVDRLLQMLPRATEAIDPHTLRETYRESRRVGDLVAQLDRRLAKERDQNDGSTRYRMHITCGSEKDGGHFEVSLARAGAAGGGKKGRAKAGRIRLIDRASCPSIVRLDLGPQQSTDGDYRIDVVFDADIGRSYQFRFELYLLDPMSDKSEVICSGGTSESGPPHFSTSCDISMKMVAPSDLPVAR